MPQKMTPTHLYKKLMAESFFVVAESCCFYDFVTLKYDSASAKIVLSSNSFSTWRSGGVIFCSGGVIFFYDFATLKYESANLKQGVISFRHPQSPRRPFYLMAKSFFVVAESCFLWLRHCKKWVRQYNKWLRHTSFVKWNDGGVIFFMTEIQWYAPIKIIGIKIILPKKSEKSLRDWWFIFLKP